MRRFDLLAKAVDQSLISRLRGRLREQARSHILFGAAHRNVHTNVTISAIYVCNP